MAQKKKIKLPRIIALACLPEMAAQQAQLNAFRWIERLRNGAFKVSIKSYDDPLKRIIDVKATERLAKQLAKFQEDVMFEDTDKIHHALYYAFNYNRLPKDKLKRYGWKTWQELYKYLEENNL